MQTLRSAPNALKKVIFTYFFLIFLYLSTLWIHPGKSTPIVENQVWFLPFKFLHRFSWNSQLFPNHFPQQCHTPVKRLPLRSPRFKRVGRYSMTGGVRGITSETVLASFLLWIQPTIACKHGNEGNWHEGIADDEIGRVTVSNYAISCGDMGGGNMFHPLGKICFKLFLHFGRERARER